MSFSDEKYSNEVFRIIRQVDGFSKEYALELLKDSIFILHVLDSPINTTTLKKAWVPKEKIRKPLQKIRLYGSNYHCVDYNKQINMYRKSSWYSSLFPRLSLYYTLSKDKSLDLRKFTKKNLLKDFRLSEFSTELERHLECNSIYKKDKKTDRFSLLVFFENLDTLGG